MSIMYFTPSLLILQLLPPLALVHLLFPFVIPYPLLWRLSPSVSNISQLLLKYSNPFKSTLVSCSRLLPKPKTSFPILYITTPSALSDRTPYLHSPLNNENSTIFKAWMAFFFFSSFMCVFFRSSFVPAVY